MSRRVGKRCPPNQTVGEVALFSQSTAANHEVVAAQAGKIIRVLGWQLIGAAAVTLTWKSATTALSAAFPFPGAFSWEPVQHYQQYETAAGAALNLTLSGAVSVVGEVYYEVIEG